MKKRRRRKKLFTKKKKGEDVRLIEFKLKEEEGKKEMISCI